MILCLNFDEIQFIQERELNEIIKFKKKSF